MAFERLQQLGERVARRAHLGHAAPGGDDGRDGRLGTPALLEIELFEEQPLARRRMVAKERIAIDLRHDTTVQHVTETRRVEHVEGEGIDHA